MLAIYLSLLDTQEQQDKFEYLYNRYKGLMFYVAFSVANDHFLAEDIVHEAFLRLGRIIDDVRLDDERETKRFLKVTTHNLAIDQLRKLHNTQSWSNDALEFKMDEDTVPDPETVVIDQDAFERLISRVGSMDEIYRTPLSLRIQGYKILEIADLLEINPQTVKVRLYRARKILIAEMEGESDGTQT